MAIVIKGRTPIPRAQVRPLIIVPLSQQLRIQPERLGLEGFEVVKNPEYLPQPRLGEQEGQKRRPGGMAALGVAGAEGMPAGAEGELGPRAPDPMFPTEDMAEDERFVLVVRLKLIAPDKAGR